MNSNTDEFPDFRLLNIDDVAQLMGVTVGTVRNLRSEGRFVPAVRIGRHLRWQFPDIGIWLQNQREAS